MEVNQFWLNVSPAFSLDETGHCKNILPDKTLGVYVPNGKKSCCKNGDVLKCINPVYNLRPVLCNVVYISFEQISEIMGIKNPDDIKEPIYVLSIDLCMKLGLEIGDYERFLFTKNIKETINMPEIIDIYNSNVFIESDDDKYSHMAHGEIIPNNLPNNIYLYEITYRKSGRVPFPSFAIVATAKPLTKQILSEIYDTVIDVNSVHKYYRLEQIYEISDNKIHYTYPFILFSDHPSKGTHRNIFHLESINVPFGSNKPEFIYSLIYFPHEDSVLNSRTFCIKLNTPITSDDQLHQIYNEFIVYLNSEGDE